VSNLVPLPSQRQITHNTYGAGAESNVTALEALLSEVRRTHAHVLWLEQYVARLPEWAVFEDKTLMWEQESETTNTGVPQRGSLKYILAVERQKRLTGGVTKQATHPAVKQLLAERQHLVAACTAAIRVGVALNQIEMAKQQGAVLVEAMKTFAIDTGLDLSNASVIDAMTTALEQAMVKVEQAAV
jgi:hypothetical protein